MLVIGAGPAGSAAALRALELGLSVSVLERAAAAPAGCREGLSPAGGALCQSPGVTARALGAQEFSGLELRTWDLRRQVALEDSAMRGWVFDRARLVEALRKRLKQAGVRLLPGVEAVSASANEQGVAVRAADGTEHAARLLLVADGIDSPTARSLGVVRASSSPRARRSGRGRH